jgi:hypothetical protein
VKIGIPPLEIGFLFRGVLGDMLRRLCFAIPSVLVFRLIEMKRALVREASVARIHTIKALVDDEF